MNKSKIATEPELTANKSLLVSEYQYFPTVTWFCGLAQSTHVVFFKYDEFRKMTFRNRCVIAGANGPINLSVPILGGRNIRALSSEVLIDNRLPWQMNHWKSICSCYNHAPWFEQYRDECREIFETRFDHLTALNRSVLEWLVKQLKMPITLEDGTVPQGIDFRNYLNVFTPKKMVHLPTGVNYRQLFQERTGFLPHLSVLDLLFCTGPRASELLLKAPSIVH